MDSIAKTSLLTAAMRAVETKRSETEGRLFSDPLADSLAGEEGHRLLQKAITESGDQPAVAIRTLYIDQRISEAVKNGVKQIVILAAGMDTRAYRMEFPTGTKIFELDRDEVISYKSAILTKYQTKCDLVSCRVDLREDWPSVLKQNGFRVNAATLWLVEGLLMYLNESEVRSVFDRINGLARSNDILVFDILSQTLLEAPYMEKQLKFLASIGAPWRFGLNDPEAFMQSIGWKATTSQPGEVAPHRWPFPVIPRSVPNVPRGFYVEARKL